MDKYLSLLTKASEKAAYRKAPIKTLDKINKLKKDVEKETKINELKDKNISDKSSIRRSRITLAKLKSGRKAFKEQQQLAEESRLKYKLDSLVKNKASQDQIDNARNEYKKYLKQQQKFKDLMREAELYKNEPLKYLAKTQQAQEVLKNESQTETIKQLTNLQKLLQAQLTPEQLLQADDEYQRLTPKERKAVMLKLREGTKRDTIGRKQIVLDYLGKSPKEKRLFAETLKSEVPEKAEVEELPSLFQIKAKKERPQKKPLIQEVKTSKEIQEQLVDDAMQRNRFDSEEQKEFVLGNVFMNIEGDTVDAPTIQNLIDYFKDSYNRNLEGYRRSLSYQPAREEEYQNDLIDLGIENAQAKASRQNAVEELSPEYAHPGDAQLVESISNLLQAEDQLTQEEAQADANEIVGSTNAELNLREQEQEQPVENLGQQDEELPQRDIALMDRKALINYIKENYPEAKRYSTYNKTKLYDLINKMDTARLEKQHNLKGEGFKPLSEFPSHLVAGSLAKHINKVRSKRFKTRIQGHSIMNKTDNQEYRQKLTRHIQKGGSFGDWFIKGFTAPFQIASKINPELGFGVPQVSQALGLPTLI